MPTAAQHLPEVPRPIDVIFPCDSLSHDDRRDDHGRVIWKIKITEGILFKEGEVYIDDLLVSFAGTIKVKHGVLSSWMYL